MNSSGAVANGIGQPVRRKEDFCLLTGKGSFADDVQLPKLTHAVIVRSPHATQELSPSTSRQRFGLRVCSPCSRPDYVADGLAPIPHGAGLMGPPDVAARVRGSGPITTRDYPMPPDQARFVGEPVALVVAETIDQAKDAAEQLQIGYEPLPAVALRRRQLERATFDQLGGAGCTGSGPPIERTAQIVL